MAVSQHGASYPCKRLALDIACVCIGLWLGDHAKDRTARGIFVAHVHASLPDHAGQQVHECDVLRLQGVEPVDEFIVVHASTLRRRRIVGNVKIKGRVTCPIAF